MRALPLTTRIATTLATVALFVTTAPSTVAQGPILVPEEAVLFAADGATSDELGRCVSVSGDTLVAGARHDDVACPGDRDCNSGSVYVYERSGSTWSQMQKLTPADGAQGDDFGECVAISGDTLVVGAPGVAAMGTNAGAIYVYVKSAGVWTQQGARLFGSAVAAEDHFGCTVDIDGDAIVAGARFHDGTSMFNSGNAYVFSRVSGVWSEEAQLLASDAQNFDQFGGSVAVSGNTAVVGASLEDTGGLDAGAAYVYLRSGTVWSEQAKLVASAPSGLDELGESVAIDTDTCVIGAPFADRGTTNPGAAYVFTRSGTSWTEEQKLLAGDLAGNDRFGESVGVSGDQLIVGAAFDSHLGTQRGSAYVWLRSGTTWTQHAKLIASDGALQDQFGFAVAIDSDIIGVGAWQNDDTLGVDQGSAYAYLVKHPTMQDFCYGDGGDQMGCTDCPCSNNARPGTRGGCVNSSGLSSRCAGFGVPSVSSDTLRFEGTGCNISSFALLASTMFQLPQMGACPPGSGIAQPLLLDGLRCAGISLKRHGARPTDANGAVGITTAGWGTPNGPPGGLIADGGYMSGQTRFYQLFYREDAMLGCGTGQNTSNGVSVTFVP